MPRAEFVTLPRKAAKRDDDDALLVAAIVKALVAAPVPENLTTTQNSAIKKINSGGGGHIYIHLGHFHDGFKKEKQAPATGRTIDFVKVKQQCLRGQGRTTPVLRTRREVEADASPARAARAAPVASRVSPADELKRKLAASEAQNKRLRKQVEEMEEAPATAPAAPFALTPDFLTESNVRTLTGMPSLASLHALYGWINCNGFWDQVRWRQTTDDSTIDPSSHGSAAGASSSSSGA
jgi:hypothetical protein